MSSLYGGTGPTGGNIGRTQTGLGAGNKIPKGYKAGRLQQFTPEQMELFQQMFSNLGPDSYLSRLAGGDEGIFNQIEAPAMRQFSGLQGNIASRFSGMGMGARNSSGFQNTMTSAASNFAQDLQSRRQGLQQQAIKDLMGMSTDLLQQKPYDNFLIEKQRKPSGFSQFMGGALPLAGGAVGGFFGGPQGAAMGYGLGNAAASGFTGNPVPQQDWSGIASLPTSWRTQGNALRGSTGRVY